MSATYVYCIVSSRQGFTVADAPAGPPGTGKVRTLVIRPHRYAVVSDAPLDQFGEGPLAKRLGDLDWVSHAAVAHEAVTEWVMAQADAVVPMKLFTLFTTDDRALDQLRSGWTRIEGVIRKVARHEEWGVRLVFDETRAPADASLPATSGRNYLSAKRRHHTAASVRSTTMRRVAGEVVKALRPFARETRRRAVTPPADSRNRLLLDAAFLVPRTKAPRFRASSERQAKKIAPAGYSLQLSGPWPPYSFAEQA
ncbi:MAG TPA: GvpL/GvpF family gas vesicle protein [Vicinamibacterales bacterium]|nr:GvpL/GvpF family gas vesicle protein [Vicinamibacterales bacterium]